MNDDSLIFFGGEVKAIGDTGLVGGYLVRFTDAKHKDLHGEFFTDKTYLGPKNGDGAEALFDHGFPIPLPDGLDADTKRALIALADHTFAPLKTRRDAHGIWAEVVLDLADEYEKRVYGMAKKNKLGWSSGAPGHRVKRDSKTGEITSWPIAEGSLTPTPAEPMNRAVSMKSLGEIKFVSLEDEPVKAAMKACPECGAMNEADAKMCKDCKAKMPMKPAPKSLAARLTQYIDDSVDDGRDRDEIIKRLAREALMDAVDVEKALKGETVLRGTAHLKAFARVLGVPYDTLKALADKSESRTIKGMFEDELANQQPGIWMLWDVFRSVVRKIAEAKASTLAAGTEFDDGPKVDEAIAEFVSRLKSSVVAQIADYAGNDDEEFYLKTSELSSPEAFRSVTEQMPMDAHLQLVVTAEEDLVARFIANADRPHGKSTKAGRELSNKNRQRLMKLQQVHKDHHDTVAGKIQELLDATQPKANPVEKRAAFINHQRVKLALQRQQTGV